MINNRITNTCDYDHGFEDGVLWLEDLNASKSLTNDLERVLIEVVANRFTLDELAVMRFMYKDSLGTWDGLKVSFGLERYIESSVPVIKSLSFFAINEKDFEIAKYKLLAMKIL